MDADFWNTRWRNNEIAFHKDAFNRYLLQHWPALGVPPAARVFVPLCGKSRDLLWLAERGHDVVGCEINHIAVESFFREAGLAPRRTIEGPVERWSAKPIDILLGDFFDLNRDLIGGFDAVYDRASLIAFPETMRRAYVQALAEITAPGTPMLLVALDYPQHEIDGPPFSVPEAEVRDLFGDAADVALLESTTDAFEDFPRFRKRGLSWLTEKVYRIRRE